MVTDSAASELAKKRWSKTTKAERTEHAQMMAEARADKMTAAERSEVARKAAAARWGPKKPAKAVKKKKAPK